MAIVFVYFKSNAGGPGEGAILCTIPPQKIFD